jgi:hypothetical protein
MPVSGHSSETLSHLIDMNIFLKLHLIQFFAVVMNSKNFPAECLTPAMPELNIQLNENFLGTFVSKLL